MWKLVRDKIPRIATDRGQHVSIKASNSLPYDLFVKLREEVGEFIEESSVEELADVMEVLHALMRVLDITDEELHQARRIKYAERGGFEIGILMEVED